MNSTAKLRVRFLKSTGTYALFHGTKNLGSNFATDKEAVRAATEKFPGVPVFVGGFGTPADALVSPGGSARRHQASRQDFVPCDPRLSHDD